MVHDDDLLADLPGEMWRLADRLGIAVEPAAIDNLAPAASFEAMRAQSHLLAPDPAGVLKDRAAFFRHGRSGAATRALGADDLAVYHARAASLAPAELLEWLHRP